jgi:argininosuccinate synthase
LRVARHHSHPNNVVWSVAQAPNKATYIELGFEKGDPVTLDGVALSPAAMLTALNKLAGANGVGRVDIVESRFVGEQ